MDMKSFEYLYHKARGMDRERIARETGLSDDEIDMMEQSYAPLLREIAAEMPQAADIGKRFVRLTRYIYANRADQELDMPRPDAVKPREGEMIALPGTSKIAIPSISLHQAIDQRRSLRSYSDQPFSLEELSFLLWASSWARDFRSSERNEFTRRNVPSAGSRHSLECYLLIQRVTGVKPGLYYYHPLKHCLVVIDQSPQIFVAVYDGCLRQEMVRNSAVTFILSAVPYRTSWRYGQRGYRYLYIDAGHVGQNIHLAAEAAGGGACMIGAFQDEAMNECLGLDGVQEFVIYAAALGKKPSGQ